MNKNKFKFGIIGTSCAGKTTLAYSLVSRLKTYGILADGVFSQDRKFSFDKEHLTGELAQNWMITNMISKEVDAFLHSDIEILITDRTPIDLFAYYATQFNTKLSGACWEYCKAWASTYSAIYYLEPLPYQNDTKRPSDEFRLSVDQTLTMLLDEIPNVKSLPRNDILSDVLRLSGRTKPQAKTSFTEQELFNVATAIGLPLLVKTSIAKDSLSDVDIWVLIKPDVPSMDITSKLMLAESLLKGYGGPFTNFDLNTAVDFRASKARDTFNFPYVIYYPAPEEGGSGLRVERVDCELHS